MDVKFTMMALAAFVLIYFMLFLKPETIYDLKNSKDIDKFQMSDKLAPDLMMAEFDYLIEQIVEVHPDPKRNLGETNWDNLLVETKSKLTKPLPITEYFVLIQSFVSKIGDSHTYVYPSTIASRVWPFDVEWVGNELFVSKSQIEGMNVGDKITHIEGQEIHQLMDFLDLIISSENEYWLKSLSRQFIRQEWFLSEFLSLEGDQIAITVLTMEGVQKDILVEWMNAKELHSSSTTEKEWYGFEVDQQNNLGYYFLNESTLTTEYEQNVKDFFKKVDDLKIDTIIIDLRKNGGGNSGVANVFIRHLPNKLFNNYGIRTRFSKAASEQVGYKQDHGHLHQPRSTDQNVPFLQAFHGDVYILIGNSTYSSATIFATIFHDSDLATIIGEPTGGSPSSFGDILLFSLPYTGFDLSISHKEFSRPDSSLDHLNSLYPDIFVEVKREDLMNQEDGQLERVKDRIYQEYEQHSSGVNK